MFRQVYFLGIGGIGMSALARYFNHAGAYVAGYERTPSSLTAALEQEGVSIHYDDAVESIPKPILEHPQDTLVIFTPAIPSDHNEWNYLQQKGYKIIKRARALGEIAASKICLAVAGSHGKTTTTTLLAHLFIDSGKGCTAFLGGISKNYQSNLLLSHTTSPYLVAEADEFDRSFLQLHPHAAVITAVDADHLDIFGTYENLQEAFGDFVAQIKPQGVLVIKKGVEFPLPPTPAYRCYRYALEDPSDFYASRFTVEEGGCYCFDLHLAGQTVENCRLGIPGRVNVENAVAASALAFLNGIPPQQIKAALATFSGVTRRFDIQVNKAGCTYIDDYAHHPTELTAALQSIRKIYPNRKITAIFQPHLYTRTRDFADAFAESLSLPDELILLPIYPAREEPIPGISSEMLLSKTLLTEKRILAKEEVVDFLKTHPTDVLVTLGAGDIDRLVPQIKSLLEDRP